MNYFKEKKFASWAIAILVLLNIFTITLLWLGRPENRRPPMMHRERMLNDFIAHELDFNPVQRVTFDQQAEAYIEQMKSIHLKIDDIKQQLYNTIYAAKKDSAYNDSLTNVIGKMEIDLNNITYKHLMDIKKLCNDAQQQKYSAFLKDVLGALRPPKHNGPPPEGKE